MFNKNNIPNESFLLEEEDSSNQLLGYYVPFSYTINFEDLNLNDNHSLNSAIFLPDNPKKNKDDFKKQKIEIEEKKLNKTLEETFKTKTAENKEKKEIVFITEKAEEKKILSTNKKNKLKQAENKDKKKNGTTHTKFANDNMIRKIKFIIIEHMMDFINKKIEEMYKNIGIGTRIKKLFKMKKDQVSITSIKYNVDFLNKKLKDIFSENITKRYSNYLPEKNKYLIEELINEQDEEKKIYFNELFNLTFLDCLEHFINKKSIPILQDLELFEDIIKVPEKSKKKNLNANEEDDYIKTLQDYLENYEYILRKKKPRKKSNKRK